MFYVQKIIFKYLGPALRLPCKSIFLEQSLSSPSMDVICHENQAFEEDQTDNRMQMQGTSEGTDRSQRETIFNQRSSSLVSDGAVLLQAAGSRTVDQTKRSEMFKYQRKSRQLVDGFVSVQFQEDVQSNSDHSKSESILNQGRSSLPDRADPDDDEDNGVVVRKEGESPTVAHDSSQVETVESNWTGDAVSVDIKEKRGDFEKEETCKTIKDDRDIGRDQEEDKIKLDSSKKKKKKKKASKLIRKTIATKRIAESFEQHIKETSGDANLQEESSGAQNDGDDSSDHRSRNTNLQEESSANKNDGDDSSDNRSQNTNLQEESSGVQNDGDDSSDKRSLQEESSANKNNGENNCDIKIILHNNNHQEKGQGMCHLIHSTFNFTVLRIFF